MVTDVIVNKGNNLSNDYTCNILPIACTKMFKGRIADDGIRYVLKK